MLTKAFVLHRYPYRETSLLVRLLTEQDGLVSVVARGARGGKSKTQGLWQPFMPLAVRYQGKGELQSCRHVEAMAGAVRLTGEAVYAGLYANELLLALLHPGEPHEGLVDLYAKFLVRVQQQLEPALRTFELACFMELGLLPDLTCDAEGQPLQLNHHYRVQPEQLPEVSMSHQHAYLGEHLLGIAEQAWDNPAVLAAAKRLCRQWVAFYTQGREFKSRQLYRGRK